MTPAASLEPNRRVLLVDDAPEVHEQFRRILNRRSSDNFVLESAYQGEEALARVLAHQASHEPYALAFIDMRMPGWDGIQTIQHLWAEQPDLEVVLCTGYIGVEQALESLSRADKLIILQKPFEAIEVVQLAHALTEKWQLRQQAAHTLADLMRHLQDEMVRRQQSEVELRQAQKLEAVGRLAAGIAHEINTPIQYVSDSLHFIREAWNGTLPLLGCYRELHTAVARGPVSCELLQRLVAAEETADIDYLTEEVPRALDRSVEGLRRVATIVRSMKSFAHPEQSEKCFADLNDALETTLVIARNEYKYVADVETDLGELPPIYCHIGEMNQVFLNLFVNAAHAIADAVIGTDRRGRITVSTRQEGDFVVIAIGDSGTGIPEPVRAKIFDPFFTTKETGRGTGQGLSIARNVIAKQHGGSLTFSTEMGRGTTFFIRIPIAGPPSHALFEPPSEARSERDDSLELTAYSKDGSSKTQ